MTPIQEELIMSREITDNKGSGKTRKISEETVHIAANLILTAVSTAALIVSIATGMKGNRRR